MDENGCIVSGKLSALIKRLLPGKEYYPEKSYVFAFLLNARRFMSPSDLLHKILQLFIFEQNSKNENFTKVSRFSKRMQSEVTVLTLVWFCNRNM